MKKEVIAQKLREISDEVGLVFSQNGLSFLVQEKVVREKECENDHSHDPFPQPQNYPLSITRLKEKVSES